VMIAVQVMIQGWYIWAIFRWVV